MVDIIFALCEIMLLIAYIFKDALLLRIFLTIGLFGYVMGGFIAGFHVPGMKALALFASLSCSINAYHAIRLALERTPITLPNNLKEIYKETFRLMTPYEFMKFYRFGEEKTFEEGSTLTLQDHPVNSLILIDKGSVNIKKNSQIITTLGPGFFIGEMSFLTRENATATTEVSSKTVECLIWSKKSLHQLEEKHPELAEKIKRIIATNLIKKITRENT